MTQTSQSPASKTARPKVAKKPRRGSTARDLLVRLTIPLVSAALTFALYLQLNLELSLAALIALLAGTTLALMHVNYQRGTIIRDLRRELLRATAPSHAPMRHAHALPMGQGQMPAPHVDPHTANSINGPAGPGQARAAPPPQQPTQEPPQLRGTLVDSGNAPPQPSLSASVAPANDEQRLPDIPLPAGLGAPASQTAPITGERLDLAAHFEEPRRPLPASIAEVPQGAPQSGMPPPLPLSFNVGGHERRGAPEMPADLRQESAPVTPREARTVPMPIDRIASAATQRESIAETDKRSMAPFWALRPGVASDPVTIPMHERPRAESQPASAAGPLFEQQLVRSARPPAAEAVDGPELEAMQKLIEQLATQLNGPRGAEQSPPEAATTQPTEAAGSAEAPPSPSVAESVATSVAALRATADTMRQAADAAPPPRFAAPHKPLPQEPARTVAIAAPEAPPVAERPETVPQSQQPAMTEGPLRQRRYARLAQASAAIADERIDVLLEPIMGLGDRKARHFEVSVRLRDETGAPIDADELADIAADGGIMPKLDAAKMVRTARVANRLQARGTGASLFSTLAGESLADQTFLDVFDDVFADEPALSSRLVLSFSQSEVRQFGDGHWDAIEQMADMGLRLALEDVTDLDMDFESLREHGFDFVKLDADVFLEGLQAPEGLLPAPEICRHFANMGLALIVGHIEDETSLGKVFGFGVLFGQGELFGGARPVSIDTSAPPATAAA